MQNQKKRLTKWITDFIAVAVELKPNLNDLVIAGEATVSVPADIVKMLTAKQVVTKIGESYFFECKHKSGSSFLKVYPTEPFTSIALELH